ncbi:hypothetical protein [Streptomyces sp. YKOK-I1]
MRATPYGDPALNAALREVAGQPGRRPHRRLRPRLRPAGRALAAAYHCAVIGLRAQYERFAEHDTAVLGFLEEHLPAATRATATTAA